MLVSNLQPGIISDVIILIDCLDSLPSTAANLAQGSKHNEDSRGGRPLESDIIRILQNQQLYGN